jgi:hypothetical protein
MLLIVRDLGKVHIWEETDRVNFVYRVLLWYARAVSDQKNSKFLVSHVKASRQDT